MELVEDQN